MEGFALLDLAPAAAPDAFAALHPATPGQGCEGCWDDACSDDDSWESGGCTALEAGLLGLDGEADDEACSAPPPFSSQPAGAQQQQQQQHGGSSHSALLEDLAAGGSVFKYCLRPQ